MDVLLAMVDSRRAGAAKQPAAVWLRDYVARLEHFCRVQQAVFPSEAALLSACERTASRTLPYLIMLDSRGKLMSSDALAAWVGRQQDTGLQRMIFAVGPADGWSEEARKRANLLLSLGPMTLPHELAAVVLAEQIYRAFTILKGLPYHLGHT
ncbi:MAG TPA: 23S rRNA (pseudouridine(1915)-N(3))-methyltransferase RlmH [Acidobacteriaceae bacterium]|jgi:23S rRNA (pseudouridine1915-N3)-methyltransferase|nr:23S rRNA (pseudouridine(1915)-N(3))-methyltransferase RlmH [Acidobacteriaceae bacterium]